MDSADDGVASLLPCYDGTATDPLLESDLLVYAVDLDYDLVRSAPPQAAPRLDDDDWLWLGSTSVDASTAPAAGEANMSERALCDLLRMDGVVEHGTAAQEDYETQLELALTRRVTANGMSTEMAIERVLAWRMQLAVCADTCSNELHSQIEQAVLLVREVLQTLACCADTTEADERCAELLYLLVVQGCVLARNVLDRRRDLAEWRRGAREACDGASTPLLQREHQARVAAAAAAFSVGRSSDVEVPSRASSKADRHAILQAWIVRNADVPYPTATEKHALMRQTGLSLTQLNDWFINARRRFLPRVLRRAAV